MKKAHLCFFLVICIIGLCVMPASAENECGPISVKLNSNIAGLTRNDVQKLIEVKTGHITYGIRNGEPIHIADYAGTAESGVLIAGRTYFITYTLSAAEGYALPAQMPDNSIKITSDKGVSVLSCQIVTAPSRNENGTLETNKGIQIYAQVVVDGNIFQRIIGLFHDYILKIKAWSLY